MSLSIRPYSSNDEAVVVTLWQDCGLVVAWNDPRLDIARKLQVNPELFLVGEVDGQLVATLMVGYDGHRAWFNYLAVDPQQQGRGYARQLVEHAERLLKARGCPKINLQVRSSNAAVIAIYNRLGYTEDKVVSLGKRLIAD